MTETTANYCATFLMDPEDVNPDDLHEWIEQDDEDEYREIDPSDEDLDDLYSDFMPELVSV